MKATKYKLSKGKQKFKENNIIYQEKKSDEN